MLVRLAVIFREHFTEDKLTMLCCDLPWNFLGTGFVCWQYFPWNIDFDLNLRFLFILLSFVFTNLLTNMQFTCEEKRFIKSVCQSKGWSTKRICKEFPTKKWAVSSVEYQCKMQKMNSIERKTGAQAYF